MGLYHRLDHYAVYEPHKSHDGNKTQYSGMEKILRKTWGKKPSQKKMMQQERGLELKRISAKALAKTNKKTPNFE